METMGGLTLDWKFMGSLYGTIMIARSILHDLLPRKAHKYIEDNFSKIFWFYRKSTFTIDMDGGSYGTGGFSDVQTYLSSKCFDSMDHMKTTTIGKPNKANYTIAPDGIIIDTYNDIEFTWILKEEKSEESSYYRSKTKRYFQLRADQKYRTFIHESYLPYIKKQAKRIQFENRGKYIYTNRGESDRITGEFWSRVSRFKHPSTFGTIAIDPVLKQELKSDLDKFVGRKNLRFTGKTSLIAAIANYLKFDIYDMELTAVKSNTDLRNLLIATKSKSVIVIEDIDCSLDLKFSSREKEKSIKNTDEDNGKGDKKKKKGGDVSLSGVLNFVDGLWSSCGGERLIIFTTNYKERLDPALLRPGRMDKHIHVSFCDFESFKVLAKNYLQIQEHEIMNEVKELLKFVQITPADVAEFLMSCDDDADIGLGNLVKELKKRWESIKKEDTTEQNDKEAAVKQDKEEAIDNSEKMNLKGSSDAKEEEEKDDDHVEIDSDSDSESDSDSDFGLDDSDY
ncbi:hypothetical protein MKW98_012626 [Papaver atlanticum]|uniref:AAA+ ATPase domain-containing protein n=1 Tax=Papaver atlanticum TaxID=357466 RepID=A0AAD4SZU5_9MAGN|nr:hypothetical protein MKW98_012626 [Papaver atlanticum]